MRKTIYALILGAIVLIGISIKNISNKDIEVGMLEKTSKNDYEYLIIKCGNTDEKLIALTFDDGPDEDFTPQILDILKKYNVKATFYVIGEKVQYNKKIIKRQYEEGHEIGNHTYTHINVSKNGYNKIKKEIGDTQSAVKSVTGIYPKTFRPPYRAISKDMCDIIKEKDMNIVLWSYVDARDWESPGVCSIVKSIESGIQNGCIILLHDYNKIRAPKSQTIEALDIIIPNLLEKGYKFVTISELIEHLEKNTNNEKAPN
ncbi:MAG: polysaccharide deacetylase family protein [Terrisporobacter othiniensis]|uniref:polysaccharide deacetylase family protein n=1 Tax=Terrisporobacter petrolearius TaxID=1460447 RepID=UPI0022DF8154|nr:polysaccharide deacetylase family protein [Terrisporobacter petrolearius]MDU4859505.1 polysaccharide deacetylase family protein [Terrisporobacter othiniensis]MDU6993892.1 polysaccharide deacetylase family protein [Terrisporobacter othiniensis]